MKPSRVFFMDAVGKCNLRCPSCPMGRTPMAHRPALFLKVNLLEEVLDKAQAECHVHMFNLYNWGESLLHPGLPDLIESVSRRGLRCGLSTNLSVLRDYRQIIAAKPYSIRVSCSGFNQENYALTHRGGDVDRLKDHLRLLADAARNSGVRVDVYREG